MNPLGNNDQFEQAELSGFNPYEPQVEIPDTIPPLDD